MTKQIVFNKPYLSGNELLYIKDAIAGGKISGNGKYTELCHRYFQNKLGAKKCLLTSSCTDALELAALLLDIKEGDEVIIPSFTFVSTANAFVLRGAQIVFADSSATSPNLDVDLLEQLITPKTKAIVVVHYAGIANNMEAVKKLADKHNIYIVEDAAQAIDSYYKGSDDSTKPLGSIGHLGAFSFHETKNIISGEGGMLVINDEKLIDRAEVIWEKGTNRSAFFRGEVDKYVWMDIGSSFYPSDMIAAFLWAQLENLDTIQKKRLMLWNQYYKLLLPLKHAGKLQLPEIPGYATNNAHIFYVVCNSHKERSELSVQLNNRGINAVFHYQSLHKSPYYKNLSGHRNLPNADRYSDTLLRLPMFYELTPDDITYITESITTVLR